MPKTKTKTVVLNGEQIQQKINRMAFQIYEDNYDEEEVILAGIERNGFKLAQRIEAFLRGNTPLKTRLISMEIEKDSPISNEIHLPFEDGELKDRVVILVDDVVNSGRTLIYGARRFLRQPIRKLRTVVLVNRAHRRYPIHADFVGISLSTTLHEHVEVTLAVNKEVVELL